MKNMQKRRIFHRTILLKCVSNSLDRLTYVSFLVNYYANILLGSTSNQSRLVTDTIIYDTYFKRIIHCISMGTQTQQYLCAK